MDNNFVENFKSEELEERLEFAKWSVEPDVQKAPIESGGVLIDGTWVGGTIIIPF